MLSAALLKGEKRMSRIVFAAIATAAMALLGNQANAGNFANPGPQEFKATGAMMAIKSPATNACPAAAKMTGWIMTNKPGTVSYMIARKGGGVSGPYQVNAVPSAEGAMATISRNMEIHQPIDAEYRILVADGTGQVMSNWAPLRASCKVMLGG
jgi:hypothetical protein